MLETFVPLKCLSKKKMKLQCGVREFHVHDSPDSPACNSKKPIEETKETDLQRFLQTGWNFSPQVRTAAGDDATVSRFHCSGVIAHRFPTAH